ncbi:putative YkwD family protein [Aneurinibacillus soli]|uniref:Cysteine-rich secretory protein family protein n=1 Tax=Aneurinibacillus soli TaxID=1500254 RepID=A0A0U5BCM2_9BACL|nr:CAP domain-containing protein [Aneurinibacillus soli]PYE62128.1 putative YkwD family protein [Aneurinibacillus soli]BAU28684.1 Cysteine-rich secretory protein family protein [Aneurinibacillus soli]
MKKWIAASVLCTSLLGFSAAATEAATTCPNSGQAEKFTVVKGLTAYNNADLQALLSQYFKNCKFVTVAQPTTGVKPAQPTVTTPPKQPTTPANSQPSQPATKPTTPATPVQGLTADEQQMLDLVNKERTQRGLAPLKANLELTKLARLKAQDMIDKNYFSHQSPTYGSPFDMMNRFGVSYRTAGENIAGNSSVAAAHTALMNSEGHRANILNTAYTEVGIGIVNGGPYGKMFVQMFKG